jgi:DNA polymerase (family 10)
MENVAIARILNTYADLLGIQGENPLRVHSYRRAAQIIAGLSGPVAQLVKEGEDLQKLPGIGSRMAEHIREIAETGRLSALEHMRQALPCTLIQLVQLEHLGPRKVKRLYDELGIASLADLKAALDTGKIEALPGFGSKTAANLYRALAAYTKRTARFLRSDAEQLLQPLLHHLHQAPGLERLEVVGSYRRRQETVGNVDILVACEETLPVMQHFQSFPLVKHVEMAGTACSAVILESGLRVALRIVPRRSYGAALYYFTGSKAHNMAVRKLAFKRGLCLNEYGIFRSPAGSKMAELGKEAGERVGGEDEEDVFRAVGMTWVPPELREDRGEIQAAQQGTLPALVTLDDIRGDLQMHSTWSDGSHTIEEMARACHGRGYKYCAITDHSKSTRIAGGLDAQAFIKQWDEIARVRQRLDGYVILAGVELDIRPDGSLDLPDDILERFDIVVASVYSKLNMTKMQMTKRILKALSHPAVEILAHPTGRQIRKRTPIAVDLDTVFHAAKEYDVALELNAQPQRLGLSAVHVYRARELGVRVAIDTDAHSVDQLHCMQYGIDQARLA